MESVLVTGSEGCIGPYVVHALRENHPDLHLLRVSRRGEQVRGESESLAIGDLRDGRFVERLFEDHDIRYVIHAAGTRYGSEVFERHPFELFDNDLRSLLELLRRSEKLDKFVFLSSATVYESASASSLTEELTETAPPAISPFGSAKLAAERIVQFFSKQTGVPFTIWRLFNVVSPLESVASESGHVFIDFFRQIYIERVPTLHIKGSGQQTRCFTWVEDVAVAIARSLRDDRSNNHVFNLGHEQPHSLLELAQSLIEIGRRKGFLPADYAPQITTGGKFFGVDSKARTPDVRKARELLGFECSTAFETCMGKFIDEKMRHEQR